MQYYNVNDQVSVTEVDTDDRKRGIVPHIVAYVVRVDTKRSTVLVEYLDNLRGFYRKYWLRQDQIRLLNRGVLKSA